MKIVDKDNNTILEFDDLGKFWLTAFKHGKGKYIAQNWKKLTMKFRITGLEGWDEHMEEIYGENYTKSKDEKDGMDRWITWKEDEKIGDYDDGKENK